MIVLDLKKIVFIAVLQAVSSTLTDLQKFIYLS